MMYDECKQKLAVQFSHDRKNYTGLEDVRIIYCSDARERERFRIL